MQGSRGGGWVKVSAAMAGWRQKIEKKNWLKRSKAAPSSPPKKQNLDQNINASKSRISNYFFENIFSSI